MPLKLLFQKNFRKQKFIGNRNSLTIKIRNLKNNYE